MRAVVLEAPGTATHVEELTLREPGPGEVRVRIAASGVCHSDLHVRDGEWERPGPIVLGHEGSGWVEAVGPRVEQLRIGDFVALSYCIEAIGLRATVEQSIAVLPPGGTAVLAGLTPFGIRASFEAFPFVDGGRRILGSNYGSTVAALDFPTYAELYRAGRLPIDRLVTHRIGLDDVEGAFDDMRRGEGVRQVVVFDR